MRVLSILICVFLSLLSCQEKKKVVDKQVMAIDTVRVNKEYIEPKRKKEEVTKEKTEFDSSQGHLARRDALAEEIEPYTDTLLSHGYSLSYKVYTDSEGDRIQSLTLMRNGEEIKLISETGYPMLHKNLGYIGADFDEMFAFVRSYGSGNPHELELIRKADGETIKEGTWVDANEKHQMILYIEDEYQVTEQVKIYDIKNHIELDVEGLSELKCRDDYSQLRDCMVLGSIEMDKIVLQVDTNKGLVTKTYNR